MSALMLLALVCGCGSSGSPKAEETVASAVQRVTGNITPAEIQIDGPPSGADLFADPGDELTALNVGALADWVLDSAANSGTGCLTAEGIATCVEAGITGAAGGTGHWNGLRIVDGIASGDQDIFLSGGKENDTSTWTVGPGSVGSSKYDLVQAYLANNQENLYFGMERRGNNGTTAFDFEFNQLAPMALPSCPQNPLVPCRSVGDVLFTFEMQGSGNTGSATPHIFTWDGSVYVEGAAAGILSSINNSTTTAGGPWGHVDSQGNWVLGNLDRFTFAEAVAPISLLPGVDACGGKAFAQVRTRSSSVATSDLKDTSKIFEFQFNNVTAEATLTPSCDQGFTYSAVGKDANGQVLVDPDCKWTFSDGSTSDQCSGFKNAAVGSYTGTVEVSDSNAAACKGTDTSNSVNVYAVLGVDAVLTATCDSSFTYGATPSGGSPAGVSYAWTFSGGGSVNPSSSTLQGGSVAVGTPNVAYTGAVVVTDLRTDLVCTAEDNASATPFAPLVVNLVLSDGGGACPGLIDDEVTYTAVASGGNGDYAYEWHGQACLGASCTINPEDSVFCHDATLSVTLSDSSNNLCPPVDSEEEEYHKIPTINASDKP